jgi:hypothetical protein
MPKIGAGEPWGSAAGHPFARLGGHEAVRLRQGGVNQAGDHAVDLVGVMTQHDHAPCRVRTHSPGPRGERADFTVAQAVEDQGEQSARRGHDPDVATSGSNDPGTVRRQLGAGSGVLAGLDCGPTHQLRTLFICGTRDVNPAGAVVFDLLRRRLGP